MSKKFVIDIEKIDEEFIEEHFRNEYLIDNYKQFIKKKKQLKRTLIMIYYKIKLKKQIKQLVGLEIKKKTIKI